MTFEDGRKRRAKFDQGLTEQLQTLSVDQIYTVFQKLNTTEQDLGGDFERMMYDKVHRNYPQDIFKQPPGLRRVQMKPYQLDGLRFLVSMFMGNAINVEPGVGKSVCGVCVADDMGLGKTLQTLSFFQYLIEKKALKNPCLVVSPLAVSDNWMVELRKFAPDINAILYKGVDREDIRRQILQKRGYYQLIVTTYDYIIADHSFFKKFTFDIVVVDEASRIKNCRSKLIGVLRNEITCRFRLLLSGTPLQNNLRELFTLLQFVHGNVFHSFEQFDLVFGKILKKQLKGDPEDEIQESDTEDQDIPELRESDLESDARRMETPNEAEPSVSVSQATSVAITSDRMTDDEKIFIVNRLHGLIKPFMIRRVKSDVLDQLPPKDEVILRCHLSGLQKYLYGLAIQQAGRIFDTSFAAETGCSDALPKSFIRNVDMYLRRVCNHPYAALERQQLDNLYYYLVDQSASFLKQHEEQNSKLFQKQQQIEAITPPKGPHYVQNVYLSNALWRSSGKLELLHRTLIKMKQTNHRILIFSQFKQILNVLEQYMIEREYKYLRFDGDVKDEIRNKLVAEFNKEDSQCFVFLLSTRAASHGLNLQSADTVIIYDCDFNAFYDLQAQDRVYRIGQTKPVKVLKFYSDTMLEQKMLNVALSKLQMAQTVIDAGGFNQSKESEKSAKELVLEVFRSGKILEENVEVLSGTELNKKLARGEQEFRIFEGLDVKFEAEWHELNLGNNVETLITEVPTVFQQNSEQLRQELKEKYFVEEEETVKPKSKRGRKKKEDIIKEQEKQAAEEAEEVEEVEIASIPSIQSWVNKDVFFSVYEDVRDQSYLQVYPYVEGFASRASEQYSDLFKATFQYMGADVLEKFRDGFGFEHVNFFELFCGCPSYLFEAAPSRVVKINKLPVKVHIDEAVFAELREASTISTSVLFESQLNFSARLLAVLHLLFRHRQDKLDYTLTGEPSGKKQLPYFIAYQFWALPTEEQLPQYYQQIAKPITLKNVWMKCVQLQYRSLHEFMTDLNLIFQNCYAFNTKQSFLGNLAQSLQDCAKKVLPVFFDPDDIEKAQTDVSLGIGIFDVLDIDDEFNDNFKFEETDAKEAIVQFGSGYYGGGFYDSFAYDIVLFLTRVKKAK